jgi:dolichyl-phosphate-mannose-protein mannosyltransferase
MSQVGSARKRKDASTPVKAKDASSTGMAAPRNAELDELDELAKSTVEKPAVEWDYRIALAIITVLAFVTRFWGIGHPNEVVFDEVHFGKVNHAIPHSNAP